MLLLYVRESDTGCIGVSQRRGSDTEAKTNSVMERLRASHSSPARRRTGVGEPKLQTTPQRYPIVADNTSSTPVRSDSAALHRERRRAAILSVSVGVMMLLLKFGGYLLTHSAAILSDAIESIVHIVATSAALVSVILAARPASRRFPYGYGKVEYFSAGVEGGMIVLAAVAIIYSAVTDLVGGGGLREGSIDTGVMVVGAASVINLALGWYLVRVGKRTSSLTLEADGKHILTDSITSFGVLAGLGLVLLTDIRALDPIVAILVAVNIIFTGWKLLRESVRGLMNESDPDTLERTVATLQRSRTDDMIELHRLRAWRAGNRRFIDFHLRLPCYLGLQQAHEYQHSIADVLREEFDEESELFIHLDPCTTHYCSICPKQDCPVRAALATDVEPFTVERAIGLSPREVEAELERKGESRPASIEGEVG